MQIKEKAYSVFDERLFSATLANGLQINILPKADFQKTYAVFTTNLGSMDRNFRVGEQKLQIPAGTKKPTTTLFKFLRETERIRTRLQAIARLATYFQQLAG